MLSSLIAIANFQPLWLRPPYSWIGHTPFAAWIIRELKPINFVELGTHSGNSYFSFCQSVVESSIGADCYSVDTWAGDEHAGYYNEDVFDEVENKNKDYSDFSRLLRMTFDEALAHFSHGTIDLLHIDGLHTYEAVKHDFEAWLPKLSPGATVMLHDTRVRERNFGVWKLWEELKEIYPHNIEFIHSYGLGVLQVNCEGSYKKIPWLEAQKDEKETLIKYFEVLGSHINERLHADTLGKTIEAQSIELQKRLAVIEQTDQARKDQLERADTLEKIVQEQSTELDVRLKAIEATDQARKDQQKRVDTLEKIVQEQRTELDVRLKAIEATDQARKDQQERAEKLELEVTQLAHRLNMIQQTMIKLGLGKRKIKTPSFDSVFYMRANPDLVMHGVDPVVHYLFHGFFEQRPAVPPKSLLSLIPRAIAERGGFAKTTVKAIKKARREGMPGVKSALKKIRALAPPHSPGGYSEWVEQFDTINDDHREAIRTAMKGFAYQPLLSVVMPVYNVPPKLLEKAIASVRSQLYPHWELCIADDASTDPEIRGVLSKEATQDNRIKVVYREQNGHISASSNSALDLAAGEFMVLLDHDDELTEHALYHIAKLLNQHPDADLIYSDEDKITEDGQRYDPYFKPDFDPLLFLAQNMISHLGVYRTALVREIGGFRLGFEGSQDWDLALRVVEKTSRDRIHHIPRVLYHWRAVEGSTALEQTQKNYISEPSIKAVGEHLSRCGVDAQVTASEEAPHHNRVIFKCPDHDPEVAIIIPTRDRADILKVCLDSIIQKTTYLNYKIIVIDNGSVEQETFELFESLPKNKVSILRENSPFNFSRLNNLAVASTVADFLCLLNNDIEILSPGWIEEMVSFANQAGVGCVGARLYYPDGRLQHGGVVIGIDGVAGHAHKYLEKGDTGYFCRAVLHQSYSAVTAACLMVRRDVYQKVGGLDEKLPIAFNDVDFCLRVRDIGYMNVWTPYAEMIHHESVTRGIEDTDEKIKRFNREMRFMTERWGIKLNHDPAYNPNLTIVQEDFSLAWPPRH